MNRDNNISIYRCYTNGKKSDSGSGDGSFLKTSSLNGKKIRVEHLWQQFQFSLLLFYMREQLLRINLHPLVSEARFATIAPLGAL